MMNRRPLLLLALLMMGCAGKAPPMRNETIGTIHKLRVGMVNLNDNDLKQSLFYSCMQDFPSAILSSEGSTEQELESIGFSKEKLIQTLKAQRFETYGDVKNFSLLLLLFKNNEQQNYVRLVNFLSKQIRTVTLEPDQLTCENVFLAVRLLVIDSHPPFADVYVNDRMIGEAPVWTSLKDGKYDVQCKLPGNIFPRAPLQVPGTVEFLCKRENQTTTGIETEDENPSFGEKTQAVLLYGFLGAISISSILLPFLVF